MVEGGTVVVIEGPRFSTKAESRWFAASGFDVVNMTQYPEAWLARELALCYANISLVTDYDVGLEGREDVEPVSADTAFRVFADNLDRLRALLFRAVPRSARSRTTSAHRRWTARLSTTSRAPRAGSSDSNRRKYPLEFLTDWGVVIALVCSGAAVVYGDRHLPLAACPLARQRGDAGDLPRGAGWREGVSAPAVHDHRRSGGGARDRARGRARGPGRPGHPGGDRVPDRRDLLRRGGLHRHERVGARERARGGVGALRRVARARGGLQGRCRHRHARGRPGAARRGRVLRGPDPGGHGRARRDRRPGGPRLRRLADLGLRPSGRRHLHQGRRRGRRPRRQDRGGHPGGRPAQPGRYRRQRGRQRRRLRRHGGGPVRDLRGHGGRRDAARRADLPGGRHGRHLPARHRRRLDPRVDHRHLCGALARRQRRARALPGPGRVGRPGRAGLPADHAPDDGRPQLQERRVEPAAGRRRRSDRARPVVLHAGGRGCDRRAVRDHGLLHLDALPAGAHDGAGVADRSRHEHHPGPRPGLPVHRGAGAAARGRHPAGERARGHLRDRRGRDGAAVADRADRGAGRVRADHGQRGRYRGDGEPAGGGPERDGSPGRGREYDQGGDEGVRHRVGCPGGAGAVRGLPRGAARGGGQVAAPRWCRSTSRSPRCWSA